MRQPRQISEGDISERECLQAGGYWASLALLAGLPYVGSSAIGIAARVIIVITAIVHVAQAVYCAKLARDVGLDPRRWAMRALVLGYLAMRRLRRIVDSNHPF